MDRDDLIKTAGNLKQVSEKSASEYSFKRNGLVDLMNKKMESREDLPDMVDFNEVPAGRPSVPLEFIPKLNGT